MWTVDDHCLSVELAVKLAMRDFVAGTKPVSGSFWKTPVEPDLS